MLQKEDTQQMMKKACGTLETMVMAIFARHWWLFIHVLNA